jgi:hypothetical protein
MNLSNKFIAIAIVAASLISTAGNPAFSKQMKMDKMPNMAMTKEMTDMAMATMENNKNLMMMGSKMIMDGNTAGDADKMLMGAKMMHSSMMTMHMGMMHMKMMDKKSREEMMSKMKMDKKMMEDVSKMISGNATVMMNMGNKMMQEANTAGDSQKMMKGSELVHMGMMMHGHSMEMMKGKMDDHHMMSEMMDEEMEM